MNLLVFVSAIDMKITILHVQSLAQAKIQLHVSPGTD